MNTHNYKHASARVLLQLLAGALLVLAVVGSPRSADARLDPFFIVRGTHYTSVSPRVLFLLDTSGSMAMDVTYNVNKNPANTRCYWDHCENENSGVLQSRIHAARNVIRTLANANRDKAEFGLMTYSTALPPDGSNGRRVPEPCVAKSNAGPLQKNHEYRFTWIEHVDHPGGGLPPGRPNRNPFGQQGAWLLCGDNRPFPYLRHDELGGFSLPNNSVEPLPDIPLYAAHADLAAYEDPINYSRRVQWFPRFIGRRGNLDCGDPQQQAIADASHGDFNGNNLNQKRNNVCGRDWYYWPYVDGDPGYSHNKGYSVDDMEHEECDHNGSNCKTETGQWHRLGVMRRQPGSKASLFAPFYSEAAIDDNNIDAANKGPMTLDDAWLMLDGITDKSYAGGADAMGGTPMSTAINVVENLVHINHQTNEVIGAKPSLPWTNAVFGHDTVASYLSFLRLVEEDGMCRPVTLIIVSDGVPDPWNNEGGAKLYERLRSVRRLLGVKTYVVAFTQEVYANPLNAERIHEIACSAAGADSIPTPCLGGNSFGNWDTCADPDDPANGCAWLAEDHEQLEAALTQIIAQAVEVDVPSGAPTLANDFQLSDPNNPESAQAAIQTSISSWTEVPEWTGHVERGGCDDEDPDNPGQLAEYCANATNVPIDTLETETFGPCPLSRQWDAGECLQLTAWNARRIYTHDADNNVFRISDDNGDPTPAFVALVNSLDGQGKLDPPLSIDPAEKTAQIETMARWLLGEGMPDDWKLPGLPNAAPILIRRIPQYDGNFLPTVGIRDPHCAGRRNLLNDNVPASLEEFSASAWQLTQGGGYTDHYDYTEAVLVGDDFGVLHAFHYDSGNELFGFVPMALLNNARKLSASDTGAQLYGQPEQLDEHVFGVASTVNNGWVYDDVAETWRHLAVFGLGPGGSEIMALDVSHMGRLQSDDPIDVVWTTTTASNAADYAATLGETWSRPALTYAPRNDSMALEPKAYLVFGSGYRNGSGSDERGRTVWVVDALTGETVTQRAYMPPPDPSTMYDTIDDYAVVSDIAVGSHCLSRYWGEMQEAYWADPAGRLYRWDLQTHPSNPAQFLHEDDGGGASWPVNQQQFAVATESARFAACQGTGDFSCSVGTIGAGAKGDVFTFSPAVVSANRIDPLNGSGDVLAAGERDQFMIAMISGSSTDTALDGGDADNDFHSSMYLLVDDHRSPADHAGFDIPGDGAITAPGTSSTFMRLPLNQIERTRTIYFPNGDTDTETRNFSKSARPLRAPSVRVTGLLENGTLAGEVFYINFTVYEPGSEVCDGRWFDELTGEWQADPGATYEISFRLVVRDGEGFDFSSAYVMPDYADGYGTSGALTGPIVEQVLCNGDNCGPTLKTPKHSPCDPNTDPPPTGGAISISTGWTHLEGFTPLEFAL